MFVNFNILNQLGSPAINSNTFANRPAAGQTGRLFVSTDTFEIYRDNGTTWDLIGGPGSSTITGTGTATQVAYFTSSQAIGSSVNLYWDNTNNRLGINTATPTAHLDVHSAADVAMQLNGTGATPTVLQQFLSAGVAQYELGYNWNASADYRRFSIYDNVGAKEVISIDQQSRYVGINYQYSSLSDQPAYTLDVSGSGRFTDNGYFDSSGTGFVGINTVTPLGKMNIVSDGSAQANLYLTRYNSNGSHLLFYSAAGTKTVPTAIQNNDELGKISFNGYNGTTFNNTTAIIKAEAVENFTNLAQGTRLSFFTTSQGTTSPIQTMILSDAGDLAIAQGNAPTQALNAYRGGSTQTVFSAGNSNTGLNGTYFGVDATGNGIMNTTGAFANIFSTNSTERARFTSGGNFLIGTTTDVGSTNKLQVAGNVYLNAAGSGDGLRYVLNNTSASEYQYAIVNGGASADSFQRLSLRNGTYGTNLFQLNDVGTAFLQEIKAGKSSVLNTTAAENGTGGGNRQFDLSFTPSGTNGFNGTDNTDQGYGYFPVTITNGKTYEIKVTMATTNGSPLVIISSTTKNFATSTVDTIESSPLNGTTYHQFTATGNASYIGFGFSRSGGTLDATVSNFSIVEINGVLVTNTETVTVNGKIETTGTLKTGAPTTGTAAEWKLGQRVAAAVVLDATQYIQVEVGGTFYKLAIVT